MSDYTNGFKHINIFFNRCVNTTTKNDCFSQEYIDKQLEDVYLAINFFENYIDNYNIESPISFSIKILNIGMSSLMYKKYSYFKNIVKYTTDYGYAYESKEFIDFIQTDSSFIAEYDLRTSAIIVPHSIVQVQFYYSRIVEEYDRSYQKLQTVVANVEGIIKVIFTVSSVVNWFFTRNIILLEIIDNCFNFVDE